MACNPTPPNRRLLHLPFSEVCMSLGISGLSLWAEEVGDNAVQLYKDDTSFSFPITKGEAGWGIPGFDPTASPTAKENK